LINHTAGRYIAERINIGNNLFMLHKDLFMATYQTLLVEKNNGVTTITINRPEDANAMNLQFSKDFLQAAIQCSVDEDLRAVVITGSGKMFCAGGDVKSFADQGSTVGPELKELTVYLHAAMGHFARLNAPVIMAVNGTAAGAGFSLAVSGDLVIAAKSAKFTMAYTAIGLSPDGAASFYLPRLIGMRKTQELMFTNRVLNADEALAWGLINRVVADGDLAEEVQTLAQQLAQGPTQAYGMIKKLLRNSSHNGLDTQMEEESQGIVAMGNTADGQTGIKAFVEKTKPSFTGKL
jgi:2-(1,2-epoxy-1,2-dihydrophenyl)acetyl-CoA isomerase